MNRATTSNVAIALALALAPAALGQSLVDPGDMPGPLKEVNFEQRLGERLPLDAVFVDAAGREVTLGDYFGTRPVVLAFVYYDCPMLCPLLMQGLAKSIGVLQFDVGREFDVVAISFAPGETPEMAQKAKAAAVERYGRPETADGWHFLVAPEPRHEDSIRRVTEAAGFSYTFVPAAGGDDGEYAHASGIAIATPDGTLAQYYYGFEFPPKDLRLALVEASSQRIGSVVDQLLLYCFRYNPDLGKYTAAVTRVVRLAGIAFLLALGLFLWIMLRREQVPSVGTASPGTA